MQHAIWLGIVVIGVLIWVRVKTGKAPRRIVREHLKEDAIVLDVRTEEEFEEDHYEGAINLPLQLLHAKLDRLGDDKRRPVILYCGHAGMRSGSAAVILIKAGFRHVHNAGSLADVRRAAEEL